MEKLLFQVEFSLYWCYILRCFILTNWKGKKRTEKHLNWKIVYSIKRLSQQITTKEQSLPDNAFLCRVLCIHGAFLLCICWDAVVSVLRGADRNAPLFCGVFHNSKGKYHSMKPLFLLSLLFLSLSLFSAEIIGKVVAPACPDRRKGGSGLTVIPLPF